MVGPGLLIDNLQLRRLPQPLAEGDEVDQVDVAVAVEVEGGIKARVACLRTVGVAEEDEVHEVDEAVAVDVAEEAEDVGGGTGGRSRGEQVVVAGRAVGVAVEI